MAYNTKESFSQKCVFVVEFQPASTISQKFRGGALDFEEGIRFATLYVRPPRREPEILPRGLHTITFDASAFRCSFVKYNNIIQIFKEYNEYKPSIRIN